MKKKELIRRISDETGETQKTVRAVVDSLRDVAIEQLRLGEDITIVDGITLKANLREAYTARNPYTGGMVDVPRRIQPKCHFGLAVKRALRDPLIDLDSI